MKYIATLDPLAKFTHVDDEYIKQSLGLLPGWVVNSEFENVPLKKALNDQYGFGMYENEEASIDENGVYKYPSDEDLYPLVKIIRGNEIFYQYEYALIAIVQKDGSSYCSRMD